MNKICRNAKNYKLTLGQEYEILQEEDGYVRIINDSGKNVRYELNGIGEMEDLIFNYFLDEKGDTFKRTTWERNPKNNKMILEGVVSNGL